ncbi:MAG: ParB N-terminal domain-containing protein [Planctomycetota bacterium]
MNDTLVIQGKTLPCVRGPIAVSDCELDPQNPRVQFLIGQRGGMSQSELDQLIWEKDAVKALAQSILQNGGVYEPIIVQGAHDGSGKYRVREGNCRTVACRHLLEQYPNDRRFTTMPAMTFESELTEEDLAVLLADMHVSGKIRWDAYEQAKHVHDLHVIYGKTYDWLGNHLRLSKGKIKELLNAHQAMKEFLAIHPHPSNIRKFSFFHEVMKKSDLRDKFLGEPQFKQRFMTWLATDKITDSKQIRNLPAILTSAEAARALDESGIDEATRILMRNDPALESDLFAAVKHATWLLKTAPATDIQDLKAGNVQKLLMLRNLNRAIEDLATLAGVKL